MYVKNYNGVASEFVDVACNIRETFEAAMRLSYNTDVGYHTNKSEEAIMNGRRLYNKYNEGRCMHRIEPRLNFFLRLIDEESMRTAETLFLTMADKLRSHGELYNRKVDGKFGGCLLYTSPSPRDRG